MKKSYLNIVLALAVSVAGFIGFSNEAQAGTQDVDWTVTYTNEDKSKPFESTYDNSIKDKISNAMPGDTLEYNAHYKNGSKETMDFYLAADVLASLEDDKTGESAVGGAYSFVVTYNADNAGEKIIFDSETIGGDNDVVKGLNQAKNSNAFVNIGRLAPGKEGVVKIQIKLDGNSQDNNYMAKLAQLNVQFGATEPTDINPEKRVIINHEYDTKNVVYKIPGGSEIIIIEDDSVPLDGGFNPRTGDSILPLVMCAISLLVGLGFILLYFMLTKRQNKEVA